jgi:hypothetical protein
VVNSIDLWCDAFGIDVDDYRSNLKIDLVTDSLAFAKRLEEKPLILRIAVVEVARS